MKKVAEISNQDLVRNLMHTLNPDNVFCWIDDSYKEVKEKFQLSY